MAAGDSGENGAIGRLWVWVGKMSIVALATIGMALGTFAIAGTSELRAKQEGTNERMNAQDKTIERINSKLDKHDEKLDRIMDAVGAKKP